MTEQDIFDYLDSNPDFIHKIQLSYSKGSTSSFVEKKIATLIRENEKLKKTISETILVSKDNVLLSNRIHSFTLEMLKTDSFCSFLSYLLSNFKDLFNFDEILFLSEKELNEECVTYTPDFKFFKPQKTYYGTKDQYKLNQICSESIESICIINIGDENSNFLLLIGSNDKLRFTPDKDQFFINNLQQIMELKLNGFSS